MEKSTRDMNLAAALLAYGAELDHINRDNPSRQEFTFINPPNEIYIKSGIAVLRIEDPTFEDVETKFIARTLFLPPNYPDALRRIKSAIHSV